MDNYENLCRFNIHFFGGRKQPYIQELISYTPTSIQFNGYFYIDSSLFSEEHPVHRIMCIERDFYHIAIYEKVRGKNTSQISDTGDPELGKVCFFPTEITEIHFRVLEKNPSNDRCKEIMREIEMEEERMEDRLYAKWETRQNLNPLQ